MKKLFTLLMMLSCILLVNAQVTESGNGFLETFNYDPEMDFNDLLIDGVSEIGWLGEMDPTNEEYAEGAIVDGMLKITLQPEQEGSVGWGFAETMDLTDNPTLTFKYKFAEGTSWYFGAEDITGGWFDTDDGSSFVLGTDELQEITIDLTTLSGEGGAEIDITQIAGVWLLPSIDAGAVAGELYFDDVDLGDAELPTFTTGEVTESGNGFFEPFNYDPEMDFNDLLIDGVSEIGWLGEMDPTNEEYAEGAIVDGMLKITLQPEQEGSVGWGFAETMDLTEHPTLTFKYKFAEGTSWYFGAEDITGGWFDTDDGSSFVLGTDELQEITIDLTTLSGEGGAEIDITQIAGIWLLPSIEASAAAGDLYFDEVVLGDAELSTGIFINKGSIESYLKIYPNPASRNIRIDVDAASVAIFNTAGQEVLSTINYVKETPINVEELSSGIYFIKADNRTQKLIIR